MQELLLFGQVPNDAHHELLQQLAGIARMQPIPFTERRLIFRAVPPAGLDRVQQAGGSQGVLPPEVQRAKNMLQGPLFHLHLARDITEDLSNPQKLKGDSTSNGETSSKSTTNSTKSTSTPWTIEFRDIPDPGTHPVSSRHMSRTSVDEGSPLPFVSSLGFDYTTQYVAKGHKFYADDIVISLHRLHIIPNAHTQAPDLSTTSLPDLSTLPLLDHSEAYLIQASIEIQPDNQNTSLNPELRARATQQLLGLKDMLKDSVPLAPGDRLALDPRVHLRAGAR